MTPMELVEQLRAENERLRVLLRPLASACDDLFTEEGEVDMVADGFVEIHVLLCDLVAIRAAVGHEVNEEAAAQ